jgi:arylsulfatase A-like enzyme
MKRPNIILVSIDSLRPDRLGCYGYQKPITPNLDRLAATGIRFDQAITGGSWTQAAFPVLLTSTYASMYGGCLGPLAPERPSPVEALAENGYVTAGFSTSPLLSASYGYHRGFHKFVDLEPDEQDSFLRKIKGGQRLLRWPVTHYMSHLFGARTRPARVYVSAAELNQMVLQWFQEVQTPFFTWIHYMDVHWPYHLEEKLIRPADIAQAWRDLAHMHRMIYEDKSMSPAQRHHYIELYERAVQYTDSQVGRLLKHLSGLGQADNTIIIVVSDHGEEFLERHHWGHPEINLYDEIVRVPLIIYLPGYPGGQVLKRQVRLLDIMPTVLDLCGCPFPTTMEGNSLVPLWNGDETLYNGDIAISERWRDQGDINHIVSIRSEHFKFIWNDRFPQQPKLFDLKNDPGEKLNVAEEYQDILDQFQTLLSLHLKKTGQTELAGPVIMPKLNEKMISRLRDLGYIE